MGASAASAFLLDNSGSSLRGLLGQWDWTRTSFRADLSSWPTVARAVAEGRICSISAADAEGAESGWFEARGITRTLCIPLRNEAQSLGVLFLDFDEALGTDAPVDGGRLLEIARHCANAFARRAAVTPAAESTWQA
ncbi:hypothetical protein AKJ09_10733 [Labilithrix luteola]|uniref:GAF domain-containing protein n=2 Tax=Labilithrix luteola TaxID=1391654 RepID=A0A0K1QF57_9BACT|nr:hypothetical protein AKJ09_10733 [Labilithrix luteola]